MDILESIFLAPANDLSSALPFDANRIPFGVHRTTGVIVEVADVPNGRACDCICPACSTPLIARQGETNVWHFAHESRSTFEETQRPCEHSLYVSLKLMARKIFTTARHLALPDFNLIRHVAGETLVETVTAARRIEFDRVEVETNLHGVHVDAAITLPAKSGKAFQLGIVLTYPTQEISSSLGHDPKLLKSPMGLLAIHLPSVWGKIVHHRTHFEKPLARQILDEVSEKTWLLHPQLQTVRQRLESLVASRQEARLKAVRALEAQREKAEARRPASRYITPSYQFKVLGGRRRYGCTRCKVQFAVMSAPVIYCLNCQDSYFLKDLGQAAKDEHGGMKPWD